MFAELAVSFCQIVQRFQRIWMFLAEYPAAQFICFLICFKGIAILPVVVVRNSKIMQSYKCMYIFFAVVLCALLGVSLGPVERLVVIKYNTHTGVVHIIKFFHRLDKTRLSS